MRRALEIVVDRLRALLDGAAQLTVLLRARRRLWIAALPLAVLCTALVGAGAYWGWRSVAAPRRVEQTEDAWRYLVVCQNCRYRERTVEHPGRKLRKQNGLLECPKCGQFKAAWYRRGSQALPPGGW